MGTPTLVIVHGGWQTARHWDRFVAAVPDLDVRRVQLPSCGTDIAKLGDLTDDAEAVRLVVESVDGPVVVLAHDYGAQAVTEAVTWTSFNVQRIIYLAGYVLDVGDSVVDFVTQGGREWYPLDWEVHETHVERLFSDGLVLQSWAALAQPLCNAAWRNIPSTYIVCDEIPGPWQDRCATRATTVRHLNTGPTPYESNPQVLALLVREEVGRRN